MKTNREADMATELAKELAIDAILDIFSRNKWSLDVCYHEMDKAIANIEYLVTCRGVNNMYKRILEHFRESIPLLVKINEFQEIVPAIYNEIKTDAQTEDIKNMLIDEIELWF